jgi:hypothetical protein
MKKFLSLFVIVVFLGLISCRTTCSEFDERILSWIPYQENDVIELYSQFNDSTIIFPINSVVISHKTHYKHNTDCGGCDDEIRINSYDKSNFHVDIYINNKNKQMSQTYRICDSYFSTYSEINNFLFENTDYEFVRIFVADYSNGMFQKLIIAKEFGVIGLIDVYGNTWILKTNAIIKKHNEGNENRKNIVINNKSGC